MLEVVNIIRPYLQVTDTGRRDVSHHMTLLYILIRAYTIIMHIEIIKNDLIDCII